VNESNKKSEGWIDHLNLLTKCNDKISLFNLLLNRHMYVGARVSDLKVVLCKEKGEVVSFRSMKTYQGVDVEYIIKLIIYVRTTFFIYT